MTTKKYNNTSNPKFPEEEIYCNKCGKKLDMWDLNAGFIMHHHLGYGSKYDGDDLDLDLCCECMDDLIESCEIPPVGTLRGGDGKQH